MPSDDPILEAFRAAAADREHGASEIEAALLARLLEHERRWCDEDLRRGARVLADGQPAMANLRSLSAKAARAGRDDFASWATQRRRALRDLPRRLAAAAWPEIEGADGVVTISRSSAVAAVVEGAWRRGWGGRVVVLDGSPAGRGEEQARRLAATGPAVSVPDAAVCGVLDDYPSAVVVVGADAVGDTVFANVCGTRMLLEQARLHGRRSLLVADSGKRVDDGGLREIVELGPAHGVGGRRWPLFEVAALELVQRWVHE